MAKIAPDPGHITFTNDVISGNGLIVPPSDEWTIDSRGVTMVVELRVPQWGGWGNADMLLGCRQTYGWDFRITNAGALQIQTNREDTGSLNLTVVPIATVAAEFPVNQWVRIALVVLTDDGSQRRTRAYKWDGEQWVLVHSTNSSPIADLAYPWPLGVGTGSLGGNTMVGDLRYVSIARGYGPNLTPGGDVMFEFDGTELLDPDAGEFVTVSGHTATVLRDVDYPLTITPAQPNAYYGDLPVLDAYFNGERVHEVELPV